MYPVKPSIDRKHFSRDGYVRDCSLPRRSVVNLKCLRAIALGAQKWSEFLWIEFGTKRPLHIRHRHSSDLQG